MDDSWTGTAIDRVLAAARWGTATGSRPGSAGTTGTAAAGGSSGLKSGWLKSAVQQQLVLLQSRLSRQRSATLRQSNQLKELRAQVGRRCRPSPQHCCDMRVGIICICQGAASCVAPLAWLVRAVWHCAMFGCLLVCPCMRRSQLLLVAAVYC